MADERFFRGHEIYLHEKSGQYRYSDTDGVVEWSWHDRPCGKCNKRQTAEGHDGCLGALPGIINACCGHGQDDTAYLQYPDGSAIRGDEALEEIEELKKYRGDPVDD